MEYGFFPSAHKEVSGEVRNYLLRLQDHQEIMKNQIKSKQNSLYQDQHFFKFKILINGFVYSSKDGKKKIK